jgi:type IV secretory pathway VirJ component
VAALLVTMAAIGAPARAEHTTATITLRGHEQTVHVYGTRGSGDPVIVSSGDGGWIHLGPQVAELLAGRGYFVVGFDVKAYLESFTSGATALRPGDEPRDYAVLAAWAAQGSVRRPILIGVSEGAGLSVLAATDPGTRQRIAGVIGLGLPDLNELGWRWRDSIIYLTHGMPKEPTFSTAAVVSHVAPAPLAAIHATHDEYVPLDEVRRVMNGAANPNRLWVVDAADHRFSDNPAELGRCLLEAIDWVRGHEAR